MSIPRGSLVDSEFQWKPSAKAGGQSGTLNTRTRKVNQKDIDALKLDQLIFDDDGKANVGKTSNKYHKVRAPRK